MSLWREAYSVGFLCAPTSLHRSYRACSLSHSSVQLLQLLDKQPLFSSAADSTSVAG